MARRHGRSAFSLRLQRAKIRWFRATQPVLGPTRARWRRSLRLRTITITGFITVVLVVVAGGIIVGRISDDLFNSRRDQVLQDSARATLAAQRLINASDANDRGGVLALVTSVRATVQATSSSQFLYLRRQPGQDPSALAPSDFDTSQQLVESVTPELSNALIQGTESQYWQSVEIASETGEVSPGLIVASSLVLPSSAGTYDLFIGYSLEDDQETLNFISRILALTAVLLTLFIGMLVWIISNNVFRPIRIAAETSRRLASGEHAARMPLQNDEHFDELSENFNVMADTLQARISELDKLSEMQQRFVSDVSHELRTPLTTIRLASEVLGGQTEGFSAAQIRAAEVLDTQIERFDSLLADLLEISRYDAGSVTLLTEATSIVTLTRAVVEQLEPLSSSAIEIRALGGYSAIEIDARRVRRIISNLVGNAIEHGEGKPVVVTIDSNAAAVAVGVRDSGIGMSPDELVRVFDRFWRADPSRKRTLGGTGLGLAIATEDAAVHGGIVEVWSRLGEGTNFRLTLPRGKTDEPFVSPVPLVPEDVVPDPSDPEVTGGKMRRIGRRVTKERKR